MFSVWASNMLKLHSWMTHAPVVGIWAWLRCDLTSLCKKEWHPLPLHIPVSLARAGPAARALRDLRVTVRASLPAEYPQSSYSSHCGATSISTRKIRCRSQHRGWAIVLWGWKLDGAAPLGCCDCCRIGPGVDGHACPNSREYRAGGHQTT